MNQSRSVCFCESIVQAPYVVPIVNSRHMPPRNRTFQQRKTPYSGLAAATSGGLLQRGHEGVVGHVAEAQRTRNPAGAEGFDQSDNAFKLWDRPGGLAGSECLEYPVNLHESADVFRELIQATATGRSIPAIYVENDYWVTCVLKWLSKYEIRESFVFKGGASLSKAYRLEANGSGKRETYAKRLDLHIARTTVCGEYSPMAQF